MKALACTLALFCAAPSLVFAQDFQITEDSKPQDNVPKGETLKFTFAESKIFPGTTRNVTVYVPKQYDPAKPACVWVHQDGVQYNAPVVFDNLIAKGEMPVTIYIAASPGVVKALDSAKVLDRYNRSYEYDGLGDHYARFVLEELLPFVEKQKTSDGRAIVLSKNGNDRCIGGESSGAVCAFTAAWERPAEFRRVYSNIGTYVGLRGADRYPTLLRKYEPKPLRVFLQDGENDLNIYAGDWWMANQTMERALIWAGYEVTHVWGKGGHDGRDATASFPDAVRWIWKDWPKEPKNSGTKNPFLNEILIPGEGWQEVKGEYKTPQKLTVDPSGKITFLHNQEHPVRLETDGKLTPLKAKKGAVDSWSFGPDGQTYWLVKWEDNDLASSIAGGGEGLVSVDAAGKEKILAKGVRGNLVALPNGTFYTISPGGDHWMSRILLILPTGQIKSVDGPPELPPVMSVEEFRAANIRGTGLRYASGAVASPDRSLLYVSDAAGQFVYSYRIEADGTLSHKQRYYHLHVPDDEDGSRASGMAVDADGRLYVATPLGIQVCDQAGRVNCIVPVPQGAVESITFGGPNLDTIYVIADGKIFQRKVKTKGVPSFAPAVKPAKPKL